MSKNHFLLLYNKDRTSKIEKGLFKRIIQRWASHASQHTSLMHFGLGDIDQVDSIRIEWTNGHVDHLGAFNVDQVHVIEEGVSTGIDDYV